MNKLITLLICFSYFHVVNGQSLYFPPLEGSGWETIDPAVLNWCPDQIDVLYDYLETKETKSFLLLKDGKIILEKYFGTFTQDSVWFWFSAGKSLRATLVGIAQEEGFLDIHDRSADYLGEGWTNGPQSGEDSITIWHQLTMTSGLDEEFFTCVEPECLIQVADPGARWIYHNGPYNLLKNVLEQATGMGINAYTNSRIRQKIGMQSGFWLPIGDNTFFLSRARDMARFGILIQNKGYWGTTPVLSDSTYYREMITPSQTLNPSYGYLWWLNGQSSIVLPSSPFSFNTSLAPDAPEDVITAAGAQGQYISIAPESGLVLIRQGLSGSSNLAATTLHNEIWKRINQLSCSTTSSSSNFLPSGVKIFPNPTSDYLRIQGLGPDPIPIRVTNLQGQEILTQTYGSNPIQVNHIPRGVYFISFNLNSSQVTYKWVKL